MASAWGARLCHIEKEFLHIPGSGRTALGTQAAMQADILVLEHDAPDLQLVGNIEVLASIHCRRVEPASHLFLRTVIGEGDAIHRADIDAGIALDAERRCEYRL